jgi:hypothetical protein
MSENETEINQGAANQPTESAPEAATEEITYHAVEKDGVVTAIWEMQGRKSFVSIRLSITTKPARLPPLNHRCRGSGDQVSGLASHKSFQIIN